MSWRMLADFAGQSAVEGGIMAMWWEENPTRVLFRQARLHPPTIEIEAEPHPKNPKRFKERMRDVLNADLDLQPFYGRARRHHVLSRVVADLEGLKPFRPPDLFQMMLIAITEQQISMRAAARIRERIVDSYGSRAGELMVFPRPEDLASRTPGELRACGLSQRKAEYLIEIAEKSARGDMDPQSWEGESDEELSLRLTSHRGVGEWTAEYILVRGLGRLDVVPASDLGIRKVVGLYLENGESLSPEEVRKTLHPWSPWRGLLAFYLLAHHRISHMGLDQAQ